jgi:hypothetical protein
MLNYHPALRLGSRGQINFPLDSCNENLREERTHRNYAMSPGGMPRRIFCRARGVFFAKKQENTGENAAMRFQKGKRGNPNGRPRGPSQDNRW